MAAEALAEIDFIRPGGNAQGMKVAVSIPDEVFEEAEGLARQLGTSRSELYSRALNQFLQCNARTA